MGKTSIIPIWLIALAANPQNVPRRLVYVVNRRTVVDQATDEAVALRKRLESGQAKTLAERIRALRRAGGIPLAISTLRGQFADNREWSADPSRPAIILGTVDMIGSRLLFNGYGIGFKSKPLHAGFLGQDVLLVHDEAHLEPAFQALLVAVGSEQRRCKEFGRFHVMELSATTRGIDSESEQGAAAPGKESFVLTLTKQDLAEPEIRKHTMRRSPFTFTSLRTRRSCLNGSPSWHSSTTTRIVPYWSSRSSVAAVERIAERLQKVNPRVETLTGTMRGKERDDLVKKPVFGRFLPDAKAGEETVYLVCTAQAKLG